MANELGSYTQAKGQVIIFMERPACPSCLGVAEQFNKGYCPEWVACYYPEWNDLYNGNATPEKTMMNFVVGRALAGKSWDQQLSGNLIYKGIVSIDENKSANEVALGQMGVIGGTAAGGVADILLNLVIKNNAAKQIISNSISGYTENSIDNIPVKKDDKQEGGK
ncbi:hypothetical protein [Glaesserella parasuis]|uniref:hypothetical protein n=1 Tax=Glaesserella parasuis TaxID=738 RepID=UPI0024370775|nr:hypothetical protein [Glaesserella parasuis]MDG6447653.1 hypothetical protein [Glaesserella parasuis]MDG6476975.1 hypothetical protein [Glaesserella parasuis]